MRFFESYSRTHSYRHLPPFSKFIVEHHLEAFVQEQLVIAREIELPLLKHLSHFTDEQLLEFTKASMNDFLGLLAANKARELIEESLKRWKADQLTLIGKFELMAEDITLINLVRGKCFRKFIPLYTGEVAVVLELEDELESFLTGNTTAATNTYIELLKDRVARHERELLEAQQIARIGNFELDLLTRKTANSPEIYRIFEIEPGQGVDNFMQFVHPLDLPYVEKAMQQALASGSYEIEYRFQANGKTKHIWSKGITVYENGSPLRIVGTVQDITDRKNAEQELIEKTVALERSNDSLEQFAYVASHDLKEPIRKIATYTDMVLSRENNLSESSREYLKKVHFSAIRTRKMVDDIMAYSTLTSRPEKQLHPLKTLVLEALDPLEQRISEKKARVTMDDLPGAKVVAPQIRQVFQNLVGNALKFSRTEALPEISITHQWLRKEDLNGTPIAAADNYLEISVRDNGIGFDPKFSEKIFTLFSRLHSRDSYEGSGLGLAIVKRIIDNHGGTVSARSAPGEGACFSFILPQ